MLLRLMMTVWAMSRCWICEVELPFIVLDVCGEVWFLLGCAMAFGRRPALRVECDEVVGVIFKILLLEWCGGWTSTSMALVEFPKGYEVAWFGF